VPVITLFTEIEPPLGQNRTILSRSVKVYNISLIYTYYFNIIKNFSKIKNILLLLTLIKVYNQYVEKITLIKIYIAPFKSRCKKSMRLLKNFYIQNKS